MGVGSVLVGVGLAIVVVAYLVRPFRTARVEPDWDALVETWLSQVRAIPDQARYCTRCGRRARPDDCFCGGCGAGLDGAVE